MSLRASRLRAHHSGRLVPRSRLALVPPPIAIRCLDCGKTSGDHAEDCRLDMSTIEMTSPSQSGTARGLW